MTARNIECIVVIPCFDFYVYGVSLSSNSTTRITVYHSPGLDSVPEIYHPSETKETCSEQSGFLYDSPRSPSSQNHIDIDTGERSRKETMDHSVTSVSEMIQRYGESLIIPSGSRCSKGSVERKIIASSSTMSIRKPRVPVRYS